MKNFPKQILIVLAVILALVSLYSLNVELQSHLGRRALATTGLASLPLDQALLKAKTESKPVLVDVSAIWCPTCRALDANVFADPQVGKIIREKFIFSRLEYESPEGSAFLQEHHTSGFPNLMLVDSGGREIRTLPVTMDPAAFLDELSR